MGTLAIYFMKVQVISRGKGSTATGAAAYRAGERIHDERTGLTFDYTRRRCEIETEILAPAGGPAWAYGREQLWNAVEMGERRADSQLAREIVLALPIELNREQQRDLVRGYVQGQFVDRGMVADVAYHWVEKNPHAHIMLTMREMTPEGFAAKKNREWNCTELLEQWREQWAVHANQALERAQVQERVDHRSLANQGTDRLPQVHLGPHSAALERRGVATEKGNHNRMVAEHNAVLIDLDKARAERQRIEAAKVVSGRHEKRLEKGWNREHSLALGHLEMTRGGEALSSRATDALQIEASNQAAEIRKQIKAIDDEGQRLDIVAEKLGKRKQAVDELQRLKAPLPTMRRWFSEEAREQLKDVESVIAREDENLRLYGTTSEAELQQQRQKWERDRARVPELEQRLNVLKQTLEWSAKALEGFARAYEREQEHDWLMERDPRARRKEQDRGMDRGR